MKRTRLKVCDCSVIKILICACMRMMEGRSNVSNVSKTGCLVYSKYDYHYTYCNILSLSNYVATSTARDRETVTGVRPPFRVCFFCPQLSCVRGPSIQDASRYDRDHFIDTGVRRSFTAVFQISLSKAEGSDFQSYVDGSTATIFICACLVCPGNYFSLVWL